nr:MAG TPA: hypothetical protein [Caudoviricetes sp.]
MGFLFLPKDSHICHVSPPPYWGGNKPNINFDRHTLSS